MKRLNLFFLTLVCSCIVAYSQIGYQVAVMDQTTGSPKANESVAVSITISDNEGKVICSENHDVTTNDVGIATISIGNANTFVNVDWTKLPLWVSATVGDITISKSQILNVPVAEHAKHYGVLTKEILCGKVWTGSWERGIVTFGFNINGSGDYTLIYSSSDARLSKSFNYTIEGNNIFIYASDFAYTLVYSQQNNFIIRDGDTPLR